jgi:uncharacterized membrane protein YfcA
MTALHMALVVAASGAAGVVNAVAGGGTLLSFPALLAVGLSPVAANVTNTVAIWPGQLSSLWAYRGHLAEERSRALALAVPAVLGGIIGSLLLLWLPERAFAAVVPWLILFACLLLGFQGPLKALATRHVGGNHPVFHWLVQLLISIYGGYFGAGIGILMLAAMGILVPSSMQHANGLKILLGTLTNGVACVLFAFDGRVHWPVALVMALASMVGGVIGAMVARRMAPGAMRAFAIGVGVFAAAKILLVG